MSSLIPTLRKVKRASSREEGTVSDFDQRRSFCYEKIQSLHGVASIDSSHWQAAEPAHCPGLPVATLDNIAEALPGVNLSSLNVLLNGVGEGLSYVKQIEKNLEANGLLNQRKAANIIWSRPNLHNSSWFLKKLMTEASGLNCQKRLFLIFKRGKHLVVFQMIFKIDAIQEGRVLDGSTADVSADAYHKYKEDVKLMSETGLEAYRLSISWSRLIPNGRGAINPKGLMYYNNLINELVKHGIQPHVTLFHLDLPQVLEDEYSGWLSPRIVDDFTAYADACFREFGDRVSHWTTVNEPNIFAIASYDNGFWPPCRCSAPFGLFNCSAGNSTVEPYAVVHHALLAHAAVVELYRAKYQVPPPPKDPPKFASF